MFGAVFGKFIEEHIRVKLGHVMEISQDVVGGMVNNQVRVSHK